MGYVHKYNPIRIQYPFHIVYAKPSYACLLDGNILGTCWEPIGNLKGTCWEQRKNEKKSSPQPPLKTIKKRKKKKKDQTGFSLVLGKPDLTRPDPT